MTARSVTPTHAALRLLALSLVLVLFGAACSSSSTTQTTATADDEPAAVESDDEGSTEESSTDDAAEPTAEPEPADEPTAEPEAEPEAMDDDEPSEDSSTETSTAGFASDDDFCRVARDLDENDPFEDADLDPFSPEFFDAARELYDGLLAIAPDEISGDVELVRDELLTIGEQLAAIDYDFTDPAFGEVMETLDSGSVDASAMRIEAYLRDVCGIDVDAVDEVDAEDMPALGLDEDALAGLSEIGPEEAAMLLGSLNLDPELQSCLLEQLPELTASQDPAILTQEICGTTLLDVVSGLTG